jgi:hypothetical protein
LRNDIFISGPNFLAKKWFLGQTNFKMILLGADFFPRNRSYWLYVCMYKKYGEAYAALHGHESERDHVHVHEYAHGPIPVHNRKQLNKHGHGRQKKT